MSDKRLIQYNGDGTITVKLPEVTHTFRRPIYEQFLQFKSRMDDMNLAIIEANEELQEADSNVEKFRANQKIDSLSQDLKVQWFEMVFGALSNQELPGDKGSLPVWLLVGDGVIEAMLKHWKTVPLDLG